MVSVSNTLRARHLERQTGTWVMESVSNTLTDRETDRQVERQTGTWVMVSASNTLTYRQTYRQVERQTGTWVMESVSNTLTGQRDIQTGRETDRYLGDGVCV